MRRREFVSGMLLTATMGRAQAQQHAKMIYRIAVVSVSANVTEIGEGGAPWYAALFKELRRLGYEEGKIIYL
jgi:hypothetical protein